MKGPTEGPARGAGFARRVGRSLLRRGVPAAAALGALVAGGLLLLDRRHPFPLERLAVSSSAEVEAGDGLLLGRRVAADEQWSFPRPLAALGTWLPLATVAVEDRRFRRHWGVDGRAVLRAAHSNLRAGAVREGASTITMQAVELALGEGRATRSFRWKVEEALRAVQLERHADKDGILELYLNLAPYGRNLRGAEAAARHWFGKRAADLCLEEAALLAGLPKAPSRLRPDLHPGRARARRGEVLDALLGTGHIDGATHRRAQAAPLGLAPGGAGARPAGVDAFHLVAQALGRRPGGGRTTVVPALQREVERLVASHAAALPAGTDVAVVVIDIAAAAVVALVGSADPGDPAKGQVNGAVRRRSPGSALKPFVYGAAFEAGRLGPEAPLEDGPLDLGGWRPKNFDGGHAAGEAAGTGAPVAAAEALRRSLNLPALRVARDIGLGRAVGVMEAAGVGFEPGAMGRAGLSLVTGGAGVTLFELTDAYATLGRSGVHVRVRLFADEPLSDPVPALSPGTAALLFQILSSEARTPRVRGGASHVGARPFMWKTGTSSGHVDALAVGHDGHFAVGVWVGRFDGVGHPSYVGAEAAEPLLAELFVSPVLGAPYAGRAP